MSYVDRKNEARELRKCGYSYSEIQAVVGAVPKSTLSGWLRGLELNAGQAAALIERSRSAADRGRAKVILINKARSQARIEAIQSTARKEFSEEQKNILFLIGVSLYWAEGSQKYRRFQFTNSSPEMIRLMLYWLRDICQIKETDMNFRLFIHEPYRDEKCELFWSQVVGRDSELFQKTIYKPTDHKTKKNPHYKGCLKIDIKGSELYWKVQMWQKMLAKMPP